MARHQGKYKPVNPAPYELSRSAIEKMIKCDACFWLEKVKGVKTPSLPGFNLNTNTDTLLKKDFDSVRGNGPHPLMETAGLSHLRPFWHEDIDKWAESLHFGAEGRFHFDHPETNIRFGVVSMTFGRISRLANYISSTIRVLPSLARNRSLSIRVLLLHCWTIRNPTTRLVTEDKWTCTSGLRGSSALMFLTPVILFTSMGSTERNPGCWTVKIRGRPGCASTSP